MVVLVRWTVTYERGTPVRADLEDGDRAAEAGAERPDIGQPGLYQWLKLRRRRVEHQPRLPREGASGVENSTGRGVRCREFNRKGCKVSRIHQEGASEVQNSTGRGVRCQEINRKGRQRSRIRQEGASGIETSTGRGVRRREFNRKGREVSRVQREGASVVENSTGRGIRYREFNRKEREVSIVQQDGASGVENAGREMSREAVDQANQERGKRTQAHRTQTSTI